MNIRPKRLSPRFPLAFPILLEDDQGCVERCMARNISSNGLFVECRKFFPLGTKLRVIFTHPSGKVEVAAEVVVTRAVELGTQTYEEPSLHAGLGLRFLSFDHSISFDLDNTLPM